jgi:hypothetical protein
MKTYFGRVVLVAALAFATPALAQGFGGPTPPPPPPPTAEAAEWYFAAGATQGPFTLTQLRDKAKAGEIKGSTQVYNPAGGWRMAKDVAELKGFVAVEAPPPPPPVVDVQGTLNQKALTFLVGTWRFEGNVTQAGYTAYVIAELTYRSDKSVAGYQSIQFPGYGGVQSPPQVTSLTGRYEVQAIDENSFNLIVTFQGGQSNTSGLKIIDRNTVENTADGARSHRIR